MGAESPPQRTNALTSAWPAWIIGLAAGCILCALALPLAHGEVWTASDLGNFYLPFRAFYRDALRAGNDFLWFPSQFTGFYLHGEGQLGLFHPWNLATYRWLSLEAAFHLELLRGYGLLFVGAYLLLRRLAAPVTAAAFGAFLAAFSSFTFLHYMHLNIVGAVGHIPWLLLALAGLLRPRSRYGAVFGLFGVIFLTASLAMLGHPQFVYLSTAVEGFALACIVSGFALPQAATRPTTRETLATLARWGGAKVLGFAAAGVALVPVWESLGASFRAAPPAGFTSDFNLSPPALAQLVAPYLFEGRAPHENLTETGLYLGAVPLLLCVLALARRGALAHWPVVRAALVLGGLALWLSLGDWGGLYRLQSALPVVGLFRAPARHVVVLELATALVAAFALGDLTRRPPGGLSRRLALALVAPFAASLCVWAAGPWLGWPLTPSFGLRAAGPVLFGLAGLLVALAARGHRAAIPALVVFALLDVGAYGASFVARSDPQTIDAYLARYRVPARPGVDRLHWGPPALTMKGFRLAGGYAAMTPDRVLDLGTFGAPLALDARLANVLRVSGVRWALGTRVPAPLPRARLVAEIRTTTDPNRDIAGIDVETTALVDAPVAVDSGPAGRAEIAVDLPGRIVVATDAPGRQLLVVSERHHAGWRAEIDGDSRPVLRVYGDYLGCVVPAGSHRVVLRFAPASVRQGAGLSAAAVGASLLWLGLEGMHRRRAPWPPAAQRPRSR